MILMWYFEITVVQSNNLIVLQVSEERKSPVLSLDSEMLAPK